MQTSPSLLPSAEGWRELYDAARGRRRVRLGADGSPRELELADGQRLSLTHDTVGNLRRIDGHGGFFVAIDPPEGDSPVLRVADPAGQTELRFSADGRSQALQRGTASLELEWDEQGRLTRALIPGSSCPLLYRWRDDGSCEVGPEAGAPLLMVSEKEQTRSFRFDGGGWNETLTLGALELTAHGADGGALLSVKVALDLLGRTTARHWSDGTQETFSRDAQERLARWTRSRPGDAPEQWEYVYQDGHLVQVRGEGAWRRELDAHGRVRALVRPDGSRVHYTYDAAGRRLTRENGAGRTCYGYDALGRLVSVEAPGGARVEYSHDGLGRRTARRGRQGLCFEHRDANGRLWSITDEHGHALQTFLWWEDRLVARLDGPLGTPLAEAWLCDAGGTPLAVLRQGALGASSAERLEVPPFGSIPERPARPTLYGHLADAETGLVHFGVRELDPELGLFLTPDPWHGGEDDPRRWSAGSPAALRWSDEFPSAGIHPYALCQFDPAGRVDRDGHVSGWTKFGRGFLTFTLMGTWGAPLNSVALGFFLPINVYMEVLGGLIFLIKFGLKKVFDIGTGEHPWVHHTMLESSWKTILMMGSSRQGAFAFGLDGFLPRVVSGGGPSADRAVTTGNVVWISQTALKLLDRPRVIEVPDISGAGALSAFNEDPAIASIVAVRGTDEDGQKWVHLAFWARGPGNKVGLNAANKLKMQDAPVDGKQIGTIHLARPLPLDFPSPQDDESKLSIEVHEYVHRPGANTSQAELEPAPWFALRVPREIKLQEKDLLEISAPEDKVLAAHVEVASATTEDGATLVFLSQELPPRFVTANITEGMKLSRVKDQRDKSWAGWSLVGGSKTTLEQTPADRGATLPLELGKDEDNSLVMVGTGENGDKTLTHPISARIQSLRVALTLAPPLTGGGKPSTALVLLRQDKGFDASVPDIAKPTEIQFSGDHPTLEKGDLLSIQLLRAPEGAAERPTACVRVEDVTDKGFTVDAPIVALLALAAPAKVRVQRHVDLDAERDLGTDASFSGDTATVKVPRAGLFPLKSFVRFEDAGGKTVIRRVTAISRVVLELSNEVKAGAGYVVHRAEVDSEVSYTRNVKRFRSLRLLRMKPGPGNKDPAAFGVYPQFVLSLRPTNPLNYGLAVTQEFFLRSDGATAQGIRPGFQFRWKPHTVGPKLYWLLERDLPLYEKEVENKVAGTPTTVRKAVWRNDLENADTDLTLGIVPGTYEFELREFEASLTVRTDGAHKLKAYPAEVQVPVEPFVHDTYARALEEHELHHTVQCTRWGPLMTALPFQGIFLTVADIVAASSNGMPDWYTQGFSEDPEKLISTHPQAPEAWAHTLSIGGMLQLAWKYLFLLPFYTSETKRKAILAKNFDDWSQYLNPLWYFMRSKLPVPDDGGWGAALARLFYRAMDLRSWTPFTGFVPTLLPDGPKNFIEQGASRASGDLYSTILTANDQFNFIGDTRSALPDLVPDSKDANLKRTVGDAVRLMIYAEQERDSLRRSMGADTPDDPASATMVYQYVSSASDAVKITLDAGTGILHPQLFKLFETGVGPTPKVTINGPPSMVAAVDFLELKPLPPPPVPPTGPYGSPGLHALVPLPPRVSRSAGFYFLPASPGAYTITAEYSDAEDPEKNAGTHQVVLTFEEGEHIQLDGKPVKWELVSSTATPTQPPIARFITEKVELKLGDHALKYEDPKNKGIFKYQWELDAAPAVTTEELSNGWKLTLKKALPAAPGSPVKVRVRLFRIVHADDSIFDLAYDAEKVPTLAGVRSYLDTPIWLPVRDFYIEASALPNKVHPDGDLAAGATELITLPIPATSVSIRRQDGKAEHPLQKELTSEKPVAPNERGQIWKLTAPEDVQEHITYEVKVSFGAPPEDVDSTFLLTVKPAIRLIGKSGHDVRPGTPLELEVEGGTPPYTVEVDPALPGLELSQPAPDRIRLLARAAPENDTEVKITARDSSTPKKQGTRRVSVKKTPPFLLAVDSADALKYLRPQKQGLVTALISGRSSGGTGPDVNLTEPLDAMERAVKALGAGDSVYLSAWFFEPATLLTVGGAEDVKTWGKLLMTKASEGVKVRLLLNDFDPVSGLDTWLKKKSLDPLKALVLELPKDKRDNLKYLVSLHPAHSGPLKAAAEAQKLKPIHIASHHQKFMVTKHGPVMKAFCGGMDIESRRTPSRWTSKANELRGWHDLHLQLEGPITRDLEQEFVLRWNRDRPGRRPLLEDWTPHEELALTPLTPEDQAEGLTKHPVQLVRTVSRHEPAQPFANERADIKEAYRRGIRGATKFLYLEGPHFRGPELADWIVAQGKAQPDLVVLMVTGSVAGGKDHAVTQHGHHLQFTTFNRIITELGAGRVKLYTLYGRAVHSKLILADDAWMMIGSANASARGLELDSELGILVADPTRVAELRARLWAHNLGEPESTVKGWAPKDFPARWDAVAAANRLKLPPNKPQDMVGEGLITFDHLAMRGAPLPGLPEAVARLDLSPDGNLFEG